MCRQIRVSFTVLLCQPHRELEELKSLWVDHIVYTEHWRMFIATRMQEWRGVSLLVCIPTTSIDEREPHFKAFFNVVFHPPSVGAFLTFFARCVSQYNLNTRLISFDSVDATFVIHFSPQPASSGWIARLPWTGTSHLMGTISLLLSISTVILSVVAILVHQPHCNGHASDAVRVPSIFDPSPCVCAHPIIIECIFTECVT